MRPGQTPESRENQMISLAMNLVEKRLIEGTATSQETTHFLKLGSTAAQLEKEKLEHETAMLKAKTEALQSAQNTEEMYKQVIRAFRGYSGQDEGQEEFYEDGDY